jgi:3-deoxy-manno-octulosonate cytidylyltransferase (CMP-KDO synthetase)
MNFWAVVPSRFGSTRFPGKPLALISGVPLLQRVVEQIRQASGLKKVIVATDDSKIAKLCKKINVDSVMTDTNINSGTDRIFQAVIKAKEKISANDVVINIQGDEPLIPPQWIEKMMTTFKKDKNLQILTLAHPLSEDELKSFNCVKVVLDKNNQALYFSRFPIPHSRENFKKPLSLKHVGIYGYRWSALKKFCKAKPCDLERAESLEQLRAMFLGIPIHVLKVEGAIQGVDVPEDIFKVEKLLKKTGGKHEKK